MDGGHADPGGSDLDPGVRGALILSGSPAAPPPARDAASVILARDGLDGLEVLLLERHEASRFAPGAFAFPGGRVEAEDLPPDVPRFCRGLTVVDAAARLPDVAPPERAVGFWVAALRELYEETGLLLAHAPDGTPFVPGPAEGAWLAGYRSRCRRESRLFWTMLGEAGLTLATDRMAYYAHWITPEERPIRYDTRFFVAEAIPGPVPEPDGVEVVGWRWASPESALAQHGRRELLLPFPTQQILRSLVPVPAFATLVATARDREVPTIRPRLVRSDGRERALLPGDPGYF